NFVGISLAAKGEADLAISVIKNSVSQIAAFLYPALVLCSLFFSHRLTFVVNPVLTGALLVSAIAVWAIGGDGKAAAFEGGALIGLYAIVAELGALAQGLQGFVRRFALDVGHVDLLDLVARVREAVSELAVVGQQQRAGRVGVEPSDRDDTRFGRHELDDGWAAVRVTGRGDDTRRLVEEEIGEPLLGYGTPVDLDPV